MTRAAINYIIFKLIFIITNAFMDVKKEEQDFVHKCFQFESMKNIFVALNE